MRTTIIPAQITTVEDKIVGNLNFTQLTLLLAPILISTFIYVAFPKPMAIPFYKIPLIILIFTLFGFLAFRLKGKIIMEWTGIISRYNLRPRYFIYDKNNSFLRNIFEPEVKKTLKYKKQQIPETKKIKSL